ncbi:MAG: DUF3786 domain-containing protein [Desulfobacterales bacterium]|nr:DUF3786 domain-containing protein [Desulfobacterales bacterium]
MSQASPVFERHYDDYLRQLAGLDLNLIGPALGGEMVDGTWVKIPYFNRTYRVSSKGIAGPDGRKPGYDTCTILCRYLIMAGETPAGAGDGSPDTGDWVGFRDLKESGPLTVYFRDNVELAVSGILSGRTGEAGAISAGLNGAPPDMDVNYDLALEIRALPAIPMLLLFNDAEEGFPASCSVLFRADVERFLDAECIAMIGYRLAAVIKKILP